MPHCSINSAADRVNATERPNGPVCDPSARRLASVWRQARAGLGTRGVNDARAPFPSPRRADNLPSMNRLKETDLYPPVKAFLEARGYMVKGEVGAADVVARRGGEEPLIVELKTGFSLQLLQQAIARQAISDTVYVAVPRWKGKPGWRTFKGNVGLCKRLGVGVLSVRLSDGQVQAHCDPTPFRSRKSRPRKAALLKEFDARNGDPNPGGMTRETIMTAYRQGAVKCAHYLAQHGPSKGAAVAAATGVATATRVMRDNHYGWFEKRQTGTYALAEAGHAAIAPPSPSP